jgi:hypothetical protein
MATFTPLDLAWAEVNGLGGYPVSGDKRSEGYCEALDDVLAILTKHGATPAAWDAGWTIPDEAGNPLIDALQEIADSHIPDQPGDSAGDELVWAQRHVGKLRGIALNALRKARAASA